MIERKAFLFSPVSDEMSRREQLRANGDGLTSHTATGGLSLLKDRVFSCRRLVRCYRP